MKETTCRASYCTIMLAFVCILCSLEVKAQQAQGAADSTASANPFQWTAFADVYYSYDFTGPSNHEKAAFLYNHKRHNEVSVNLALLNAGYHKNNIRANLGLMAGTYPQYNLAAEPQLLRSIYEANLGVRLSKKKNLWIDAGILPSHIGFESAITSDNRTLTRSILAENSPYYEAGVKLSYTSGSERWFIAGLLLNGWQRISRVDGNNTPAFGTQLTYTPTDKVSFNWSTFVGTDQPDSIRKWRYFNNFYAVWQLSAKLGVTLGFDLGVEQKKKNSSGYNTWYTPVMIICYQMEGWAVAGRAEYYSDTKGVIVPLVNNATFQMQGYSINVDREIGKKVLWRTEGRFFYNHAPYFKKGNTFKKYGNNITTSLAIRFD